MIDYTARCEFLIDNLDLVEASGVDDAQWEHFQIAHLCDDGTFRIENKSRQIAWSWLIAAESVANAVLDGISSAFISINLDESMNKIRYAKRIQKALNIGGLPEVVRDTLTEIEFDNGARIVSLTSQPPRGLSRYWVYPDEFAHVARDRDIYTAALPIISKGGKLRIGSSPMGASGVFWEIDTEAMRQYPGYKRKRTPWWEVRAFCLNVAEARKLAPMMQAEHRVELFGNDRIKAIFANMPVEDFEQEYECSYVDETTSWITWEEIKGVQDATLNCRIVKARETLSTSIREAIDGLLEDRRFARVENTFAVGVDIGRTKDATEIFVTGVTTAESFPLRLAITLEKMGFEDQESVLADVFGRLPVQKGYIDRSGIGRNLAEKMEKQFGSKVEGVDFTSGTKTLWATEAKTIFQRKRVTLPVDRDMAYQIHSIKKIVTGSKNLIFDTSANEKHHADKFWAMALALAAANADRMTGKKTAGAMSQK